MKRPLELFLPKAAFYMKIAYTSSILQYFGMLKMDYDSISEETNLASKRSRIILRSARGAIYDTFESTSP